MKRLYTLPLLLVCGVFSLISTQEANAACTVNYGHNQIGPHYNYNVRYGAKIIAGAFSSSSDCDTYGTDITNWPSNRLTKKNSDSTFYVFSYDENLLPRYFC